MGPSHGARRMAHPDVLSAQQAPTSSTHQPPAGTATPTQPTQGKSSTVLKRPPPLPKLPTRDLKIVFRPGGGLDLSKHNGGYMLSLVTSALQLPIDAVRTQDAIRINPRHNSFTISTPAEDRARRYVQLESIKIIDQVYPMKTYIAPPDNAIRGIIYNAIYDQTSEEIFTELKTFNQSPSYLITDARRLGHTKSILVTFINTKSVPKQLRFYGAVYHCHPFIAKAEACFNCRRPGHRSDVCTAPKKDLCQRCGETHVPTDPPTCPPQCILCGGPHFTGSRDCSERFNRPGNKRLTRSTAGADAEQTTRQSRSKHRTSSTNRVRSRSAASAASTNARNRSPSFPPLTDQPPPENKVSWGPRSSSLVRENKQLKEKLETQGKQIQQQNDQIKKLNDHIAKLTQQMQTLIHRLSPAEGMESSSTPLPGHSTPLPPPPPTCNNTESTTKTHTPAKRKAPHQDIPTVVDSQKPDLVASIALLEEKLAEKFESMTTSTNAWAAGVDARIAMLEQQMQQQQIQIQTALEKLLSTTVSQMIPPESQPQDGRTSTGH